MGKKRGPSIMLDERPALTVVRDGEGVDRPTESEIDGILAEMIDRGIPMSLEAASKSPSLVAKARSIWEAREAKRLKELGEKARKEAEAALRKQEEDERRALAAAEAALDQMLEAETAPPAPPEAITAFVEANKAEATGQTLVDRPVLVPKVPEAVSYSPLLKLKQEFGDKLPEVVFLSWMFAAAFRWWLTICKKQATDAELAELSKPETERDTEYAGSLQRFRGSFDDYFKMINRVIEEGWNKDINKDHVDKSTLRKLEGVLVLDPRFLRMTVLPSRLSAKEKVARKKRADCEEGMAQRLVAAGFFQDEAMKMAGSWMRKWDGDISPSLILRTKAVNKAMAGDDIGVATKLATAAGLTADEFAAYVEAKKAELAELAAKQAATALANRGPQAGAMSPRAKPKSKKDEGNKKKRGGQGDRRR